MPNNIKKLRKSKHITMEQLASYIGVGKPTVSRWENEKNLPTLETWQKLADFFDVSVPYLQGKVTYKALDPAEKGVYNYVTVAMDRAFNEYAVLPETREKILKTIAYSIENGEFN